MPITSNTLAHLVAVFVIAIGALACAPPVDRCLFASNNLCATITATDARRLGSLGARAERP